MPLQTASLLNLYNHLPIEVYFKQSSDTFVVVEEPLYEFSGDGEHLILYIRKKNLSTWEALKLISNETGIKFEEFGYAGLKDKNALTYQYISINKKFEKDILKFSHKDIKILNSTYHKNKLKIGHLKGNKFIITLKKVMPNHLTIIKSVLTQIEKYGIANYFGQQRFGNEANNYERGYKILKGEIKERNKKLRRFFINSYQSYLFNKWLSKRIEVSKIINEFSEKELINYLKFDKKLVKDLKSQPHIFKVFNGDLMHHYPYGKLFYCEDLKSEAEKFYLKDRVVTGLLVGSRVKVAKNEALIYEKELLDELELFKNFKINGDRRFAIVFPKDIEYKYNEKEKHLKIEFFLPKSSYATEFIKQLLNNF